MKQTTASIGRSGRHDKQRNHFKICSKKEI